MERCPNCRARFTGEPVCYRCGCDLSLLLQIEARAEIWERFAAQRLGQGDLKGAERALRQALHLQHRPLTRALQGFIQQLAARPSGAVSGPPLETPEGELPPRPLHWWQRLFGRASH